MMCLACAFAGQAADEIVFTTVLENPITPVKNQSLHIYRRLGF